MSTRRGVGATRARTRRWRAWQRVNWWFADLLNRSPRSCWARLVPWVMWRSDPLRESFDQSLCRQDVAANGSCYCGKLRADVGQSERSEATR